MRRLPAAPRQSQACGKEQDVFSELRVPEPAVRTAASCATCEDVPERSERAEVLRHQLADKDRGQLVGSARMVEQRDLARASSDATSDPEHAEIEGVILAPEKEKGEGDVPDPEALPGDWTSEPPDLGRWNLRDPGSSMYAGSGEFDLQFEYGDISFSIPAVWVARLSSTEYQSSADETLEALWPDYGAWAQACGVSKAELFARTMEGCSALRILASWGGSRLIHEIGHNYFGSGHCEESHRQKFDKAARRWQCKLIAYLGLPLHNHVPFFSVHKLYALPSMNRDKLESTGITTYSGEITSVSISTDYRYYWACNYCRYVVPGQRGETCASVCHYLLPSVPTGSLFPSEGDLPIKCDGSEECYCTPNDCG